MAVIQEIVNQTKARYRKSIRQTTRNNKNEKQNELKNAIRIAYESTIFFCS